MADIAILVAEEYERRTKDARKKSRGEEAEPASLTTVVRAGASVALKEMKWAISKVESVVKDLEPRSQLGVAAFSGLFSA